jgi:hypothetical protein
MKKHYFLKQVIIVALVSFIILILTSCGLIKKISSPGEQLNQAGQQTLQAPKELKEIETTLEEIFQILGAPALGQKEKQENIQIENEAQTSENNKDSAPQGNNTKDYWSDISRKVESLHLRWNEYMPEAVEKGADNKIIDDFGSALNTLTTGINDREKEKYVLTANRLHAVIPELYSLYEKKDLPQLKRIIFYTRSCILYSLAADWASSNSYLEELKSTWTILKRTLKEGQKQISNKVDLSIYELEKVVKEENSQLTNIKGRITLINIEELEKSLENEAQ